ncbi:MAG: hypothetical protein ACI4VQ_03065 [Clostridia bacterium]
MRSKKIIYIIITVICVIAILIGLVIGILITLNNSDLETPEENTQREETPESLKKEFNLRFNNYIDLSAYDTSLVPKLDDSKDIVYTAYDIEKSEDGKYEVDLNVPVVNINNEAGKEFNSITQSIFANKATEILENSKIYTIYSIDYTGYIYKDILSVVIKSTLKEGSSAQRIIVKTYNYNLATGEKVNILESIEKVGATTSQVNTKIKIEITEAIKESNKIQASGFETFSRDISSEIYNIENITDFFITEEGKLYIIFAYGNDHFTSEMDIIEI